MSRAAIGCLPLVRQGKAWYVVIITSRHTGHWIIPKGHPEKRLSHREVASLEAYEEAGVMGKIKPFTMTTRCRPTGKSQVDLTIHPMIVEQVLNRWPESKERRRRLLPVNRACRLFRSRRLARTVRRLAKKTL